MTLFTDLPVEIITNEILRSCTLEDILTLSVVSRWLKDALNTEELIKWVDSHGHHALQRIMAQCGDRGCPRLAATIYKRLRGRLDRKTLETVQLTLGMNGGLKSSLFPLEFVEIVKRPWDVLRCASEQIKTYLLHQIVGGSGMCEVSMVECNRSIMSLMAKDYNLYIIAKQIHEIAGNARIWDWLVGIGYFVEDPDEWTAGTIKTLIEPIKYYLLTLTLLTWPIEELEHRDVNSSLLMSYLAELLSLERWLMVVGDREAIVIGKFLPGYFTISFDSRELWYYLYNKYPNIKMTMLETACLCLDPLEWQEVYNKSGATNRDALLDTALKIHKQDVWVRKVDMG